ncbi:MAG TPA: hypothetical protein VK886_21870 [Vicinamibacterales bacterium]|nr:hypothetical protein [Vicinamibacterales bacterium]
MRSAAQLGFGFLTLAVLTAAPSLHGDADAVRLEPAVARYLDRCTDPLTSYRAFRRLEADGMGQAGWLEAWTSLEGDTFSYEIVAEGGSERVRRRVLRKVLETERLAWVSGEARRSGIDADNYEFLSAPEQPEDLLKVLLKPRRKGKLLVNGAMFLGRHDAALVRVEGRLASSPSFWIKHVDLTRRYEQVNGFNLPVDVETLADLRFAGTGTLRMSYRYTHVNGRPIGLPAVVTSIGSGR